MVVSHWICPECGEKIYSPEIPQVGDNRRYREGVVTEEDVDAAYAEYDEAVSHHECLIEDTSNITEDTP
jgi:hypothetical protein